MSRRKLAEGRYTVSGHGHEDKAAPSVGAGISCAYDFAREDRHLTEERTYYVRDLGGMLYAMVTKGADGVHRATVVT